MSKTTAALEVAVALVLENRAAEGARQTARQRSNTDKAFATILKLIAPRIRHFIRQYGLVAHWDDAEQCCAIGVHRAIEAYQPEKAQFTTFVNWQLRGELQSLRFRLMTDQRPSAKKVEATTVSLHAFATGADGEEASLESLIEDEDALALTQAAASNHMASKTRTAIIDAYVDHLRNTGIEQLRRRAKAKRTAVAPITPGAPRLRSKTSGIDPAELDALEAKIAQHRLMAERRVFDDTSLEEIAAETGGTKEQVRQITKRVTKSLADFASNDPRFGPVTVPARPRGYVGTAGKTALLPVANERHIQLSTVSAIDGIAPVTAEDEPAVCDINEDALVN